MSILGGILITSIFMEVFASLVNDVAIYIPLSKKEKNRIQQVSLYGLYISGLSAVLSFFLLYLLYILN